MKGKRSNRLVLGIELILTLFIIGLIAVNSFENVTQEVRQYQSGLASDYARLIDGYTTDFQLMVSDATREIEKDVSYEEMEAFLQGRDADYEAAIGSDVYDGFSLMYKGRYAKSWDYGDYSDYDPTTRPWYITAQAADGEIAVTAPYVTFLDQSELAVDDEYIVLTITQKYNDDIAFCYDIKTFGVSKLLSERYSRYRGTFALMYDANGYILSSTTPEYYCHNVYQQDSLVTAELVSALSKAEQHPDRVSMVWQNHQPQFSYLTRDDAGDYYLVAIPFLPVAEQAFAGILLIAVLLIALEIWIYYRTEKQRITELELAKVKNVSQMKQDFLARMSHDMRTPMNGILGLSALSAEETDVAVLHENFRKVQSSGEYLLGLINDSLDLQKIESGKLVLNPTVVSTQEIVSTSLDMIRLSAQNKNINFVVTNKNAELNSYVRVDSMRIRQIFVNLLSNAIKFTPPGGTVEFAIEVLGREGRLAHGRITVSDTGIGMSPEFIQNHLYKPFSQEHNALTDISPGTGLGLSIVKKLVDLMGAQITVESMPGKGTTFRVDIDFETVEAPPALPQAAAAGSRPDTAALQGRRILLAEDHPLNAEIAVKLLEKAGCSVTWAKNGRECCELFRTAAAGSYDAILMDIRMPEMDGLEAARFIRALPRPDAAAIPIVAMSANAYAEDVQKSLQAGMNGHLSKPVEPARLYAALAGFLPAPSAPDASARPSPHCHPEGRSGEGS